MCILCVIQKWSRRVATMLPWLVLPLIGLWAMSQLLPPAFRFEITSPRLACVFVLLVTLFWYEILMPQLSAWRVRRNARLRERKRFEAIEMQKLRKTATRRCRNCLTPYRDQNPGGGKFMCSYCGHISKRPVLDLPVPQGMGNSGILKDLVGQSGKIFNGKVWSDNGWMYGQDWLENRNWTGGQFAGDSTYWKTTGNGLFGGVHDCSAEKSYSRVFIFLCKVLTAFLLSISWLWRKVFRVSSSRDDTSTDAEHRGMLDKRGENGGNLHESRGEKARRKAEEKRLARLEKELLEEEERKQREEVARLIEERRRLRDDKLEPEKEQRKGSPPVKERDYKREAEKKRQERKKDRDRGSSKSNSDAEELEKKAGKESERNKKSDVDIREQLRTARESLKSHSTEVGHGFRGATASNHNRGDGGTRYLDRMRGTLLSSSRAFTGGGFFGKSSNTSTVSREQKPNTSVDHVQTAPHRRDLVQPDRISGKPKLNGDDKTINRPVLIEPQPSTAPKKSWQQLFTRSSSVSPQPNSNVISRPKVKTRAEVQSPPVSGHPPSAQSFDNPINSPFALPSFSLASTSSSTCLPLSSEAMFPKIGEVPRQLFPEETEIFEEPCYVPDPAYLFEPVSESFDNLPVDLGFVTDEGLEKPRAVNTRPATPELTKPSPIESPLSRSRASQDRHASSFLALKAQDNSDDTNGTGTWHMWNSSPLVQDSLGSVGMPVSWLPSPEPHVASKEDIMHPAPQKTMASLFKKEEQPHSGTHSFQSMFGGNFQNGGTVNSSVPGNANGPWLPQTLFRPNSLGENQIPLKTAEGATQNGMIFGNSSGSAANHQFEVPVANSWARNDWTMQGSRDGVGSSPMNRPHIGGLYSNPDVQSLWSYD